MRKLESFCIMFLAILSSQNFLESFLNINCCVCKDYRSNDLCFSGLMPIPIITDQVGRQPIYLSGVKMKINAKIYDFPILLSFRSSFGLNPFIWTNAFTRTILKTRTCTACGVVGNSKITFL